MERRLAAILATDVVGYSRLIRADEEGTIAALKALRADLIDPKLGEYNGRIVKLKGDGMLAEFQSVVDAVRAAVATQQAVTQHNARLPGGERLGAAPLGDEQGEHARDLAQAVEADRFVYAVDVLRLGPIAGGRDAAV